MDMQRFTHLGRPIDLNYPTNLAITFICICTLIMIVICGVLSQGLLLSDALFKGRGFAGTVFLTWALGREFDPDGEILAFFPIPLAIMLVYWLGFPTFDLLFLTLLLMRIVNRTIGLAPTPGDVLLVVVLMVWVSRGGEWYIVFCTAMAFVFVAFLVRSHPSHKWITRMSGVAAILLYLTKEWLYNPELSAFLVWMVLCGILGVTAMFLFTPEIRSLSDHNSPIYLQRVQASWLLALLLAILTVCLHAQGFAAMAPLWSVFIVVGGYRLLLGIFNRWNIHDSII